MGNQPIRALATIAWAVTILTAAQTALGQTEGTGGRCIPISERGGRELGCFINKGDFVSGLALDIF